MAKILILFAHPRFEHSLVHQSLSRAVERIHGITFHDLYQQYPDYDIQVQYEQDMLISHDIIIFQHPFYWYSCPPLMKQWLDLVLQHGWAYGREGRALEGKIMFNAISTGGRQEAYKQEGFNRFTMAQFLVPFEQTARLCRMEYYPPFVIHGTHLATPYEIEKAGETYQKLLEGLGSGKFSNADFTRITYLNELILETHGS
jgi:glutathione-regulated potassium-efflux system ancillary protein KefG